ncbi:protein S100-A7 [Dipodomys spectabilis]|uniref:protein S100-A7 n=1 Tax=Dipodomys spectabilis TaxID=105255 RepID=UPI001C549499|nr:protein S100-A7 [Dipodomys spectabilis]
MSNTEAEKMLISLLKIYHDHASESDVMDKSGLTKMMKENFPTFLLVCEKENPDFLEKFFKQEDTDGDQKINFPEFMSIVAAVTTEFHNQSHEQKP